MTSFSQLGQDTRVLSHYNNKRYGYFIEIGAYNGITLSNTYLLEKNYGWTGLCIEPSPYQFPNLVKNRPNSICINTTVYNNDGLIKEFIVADMFSGIVDHIDCHKEYLNNEKIKVVTVKLDTLLKRYHSPSFIDYLSIDTEGSELEILRSVDFSSYRFGMIHLEHNGIEPRRMNIRKFLEEVGYTYQGENYWDDEYVPKMPLLMSPKTAEVLPKTAEVLPTQQKLSAKKMRGMFYNSVGAFCSIWESGKMCYNILKNSDKYDMSYSEERVFDYTYDFVVVNQHFEVNNWVTCEMVKQFGKPVYCIVTEITQGMYPIGLSPDFYTGYIVLDPSISDCGNIYGFCRPLEDIKIGNKLHILNHEHTNIPIIGSFGFPNDGKKWGEIIRQVNKEFDRAIIRFNAPCGSYVDTDIYERNIKKIREDALTEITKPGISFELTNIHYTKEELVEWCSKNTINIFFYYRGGSGLAAVTDQAITANRPLLVTDCPTFRHIHMYLKCYPNIGIKQAITETVKGVETMRKDWTSSAFLSKFERILPDRI